MAQPSLTTAIKKLELELGGELFRRERSRTHLTDLGKLIKPHLETVYAASAAAKVTPPARTGQLELGLARIANEFEFFKRMGNQMFSAPEFYRVHGLLLASRGDPVSVTEAEQHFQTSLELARNSAAKSYELRSAMSLACHWHAQGKTTEARDLLAPVYDWFTEGFDTADLKEVKALLDELS